MRKGHVTTQAIHLQWLPQIHCTASQCLLFLRHTEVILGVRTIARTQTTSALIRKVMQE